MKAPSTIYIVSVSSSCRRYGALATAPQEGAMEMQHLSSPCHTCTISIELAQAITKTFHNSETT
jgi:hypothetical protein